MINEFEIFGCKRSMFEIYTSPHQQVKLKLLFILCE